MLKKSLLFMYLSLMAGIAFGQVKIDSVLQKKITAMFIEDQKWRKESIKLNRHEPSDYNRETIDKNWALTDSLNLIDVKRIINKYGYPGFSLVGERVSNRFWAIVQHCDDDVAFQEKVLALMDNEVNKHNASAENYAYLKDRVLLNKGGKQLFGTQARFDEKLHKHIALPIQDSALVDIRRKKIGLVPLKEYLKEMDSQY
ncbi:hypothetical protein KXQ82_19570 [Mucilaginibacter sp. HMF5004]|uniref:DUF6624 domain-containing protein n=1 Tax=Mucilaginibacter rivuli TaxID=2857527 RepID=UPI001C5E423A|nr:DUF6624 domain-containing protein [Mucilaginibacter rivuli]MBW4891933.1 hypothetical protein [Mucilaginibacter rivuli]